MGNQFPLQLMINEVYIYSFHTTTQYSRRIYIYSMLQLHIIIYNLGPRPGKGGLPDTPGVKGVVWSITSPTASPRVLWDASVPMVEDGIWTEDSGGLDKRSKDPAVLPRLLNFLLCCVKENLMVPPCLLCKNRT